MADREPIGWITVSGVHVPLFEGESKQDAINRAIAKHNEDKKEADIKRNQAEAKEAHDRLSSNNSEFHSVNSDKFSQTVQEAKDSRDAKDRWRVDVHKPNEYDERNCKMYTNAHGSVVAVDKNGDIISVCKSAKDGTRGGGAKLLQQAVALGGRKLDSFAGNHDFYTKNGFEPISWTPFNPNYAPDGWKESGCKKENVVFYAYVGKGNVKYTGLSGLHKFLSDTKPFTGDSGYDDAYAYRDSKIKK